MPDRTTRFTSGDGRQGDSAEDVPEGAPDTEDVRDTEDTSVRERASEAAATARDTGERVASGVSGAASSVGERASAATDRVQATRERAERGADAVIEAFERGELTRREARDRLADATNLSREQVALPERDVLTEPRRTGPVAGSGGFTGGGFTDTDTSAFIGDATPVATGGPGEAEGLFSDVTESVESLPGGEQAAGVVAAGAVPAATEPGPFGEIGLGAAAAGIIGTAAAVEGGRRVAAGTQVDERIAGELGEFPQFVEETAEDTAGGVVDAGGEIPVSGTVQDVSELAVGGATRATELVPSLPGTDVSELTPSTTAQQVSELAPTAPTTAVGEIDAGLGVSQAVTGEQVGRERVEETFIGGEDIFSRERARPPEQERFEQIREELQRRQEAARESGREFFEGVGSSGLRERAEAETVSETATGVTLATREAALPTIAGAGGGGGLFGALPATRDDAGADTTTGTAGDVAADVTPATTTRTLFAPAQTTATTTGFATPGAPGFGFPTEFATLPGEPVTPVAPAGEGSPSASEEPPLLFPPVPVGRGGGVPSGLVATGEQFQNPIASGAQLLFGRDAGGGQ